jgi:beta-lactamase class A
MQRWGAARRTRAALATLVFAGGLLVTQPPADAATCTSVFPASFANDLAARYPGIRVTAAVHDTRTGCWHNLRPGVRVGTASVIKAQVLGAVLLKAQDAGRALTSWERSQIGPMVRYSFNPETANLYVHVGLEAGMHATDARFGVRSTTHDARFGATQSTAVDRTNVALRLLYGGGSLTQANRDIAWSYLSDVHPLQEWGISAGVPVGWSVAQKNGFYPSSGVGWRVGSSGFVRQDDRDQGYAITVMTEGASSQRTGIRLTEEVARRAAAALTVGPGAARPWDRARCVQTSSGETWSGVAARLGLPGNRAGEVRTVAGGNPSPLSGQLACSPDIPAEPMSPTSAVKGRYAAAASDLDCDGRDDLLWYGPGSQTDVRWAGHADRRFRWKTMSVQGDYIPVAGDFDGDGCGDVLWYAPGTRGDHLWSGRASGPVSQPLSVKSAGFVPRVGDFDADGHDDIFWYRPGTGDDLVWFGEHRGHFTPRSVRVDGAYDPVVADLDGDGADDVFWYGRGAAPEAYWRGRAGPPATRGFTALASAPVAGAYRPVAGDNDGDGDDEITWYGPGTAKDVRWSGAPGAIVVRDLTISGDYLPLAGDFDGDGRDDIAWYGPGGKTDWMWWGQAGGGAADGPLEA